MNIPEQIALPAAAGKIESESLFRSVEVLRGFGIVEQPAAHEKRGQLAFCDRGGDVRIVLLDQPFHQRNDTDALAVQKVAIVVCDCVGQNAKYLFDG